MTRYATQTGHHVNRRFGWDCHGLPVEYEIDKKLGERAGRGGGDRYTLRQSWSENLYIGGGGGEWAQCS